MDLADLYRDVILDHNRQPRNFGPMDPADVTMEGFNPLCGDEIVVYLQLDDASKGDDAVVSDVRIGGQGCSISQSSASMMSAAVTGKTVGEVKDLTKSFKAMMSIHEGELDGGEPASVDDANPGELRLGDLEALRGVVKFPVRIKCATLSWNTLQQAIDES